MKKTFVLTSCLILIALLSLYLFIQSNWLQVTTYQVHVPRLTEKLEGFRILQLSDLHSKKFGRGNSRLLQHILKINPNIILMTGDMINATDDDGSVVINLIQSLEGRYPILYSLGNHEQLAKQYAKEAGSNKYEDYLISLKELDVILLDNARAEITVENASIELYGFTLPLTYYTGDKVENFLFDTEIKAGKLEEALGNTNPETLTILLAHTPKFFEEYVDWGADLIFSGHVHGGLIRIPGIGGLIAPQQGFFPDYSGGSYKQRGKTMIVNRGKGSHLLNLRINNRPQITVVDLVSSQ